MPIEKERLAFYVLFTTLIISLFGVSYTRYTIYLSPVLLLFIWLTSPHPRLHFNRNLTPFIAIIFFGILTIPIHGLAGLKWLFFISVYVISFTLFDFSRISIDVFRMGLAFFLVFIITALTSVGGSEIGAVSIIDSESPVESTIAFSFGMISAYFLITKNHAKALVFAIFTFLALKRIALIAIVAVLLATLLPTRVTRPLLRPWFLTTVSLATLPIAILFTNGYFDKFIVEVFGISANHLSMGRQEIWRTLLTNVGYDFWTFIFYGAGSSGAINALESPYKSVVLIHNDILALYVDYGLVFIIFFLYALSSHSNLQKSLLAGYLMILFLTDNVLIYQHTMMIYLICQSQLERAESSSAVKDERYKPDS